MNPQTQRISIEGPAGELELAVDAPTTVEARGTALVCHPHPLHGGTLDNKVVQTIARAYVQAGWRAVRFNFRGVGHSQGQWEEGRGEVDDAWAVVQSQAAEGPLALAGFSFGSYVAAQLAHRLQDQRTLSPMVLVGPATSRFAMPSVPSNTLVIHGEQDDVVPLSATLDWARPQSLPVVVVPGVGHFFHGQLPLLKSLVLSALHQPTAT